MNSSSERWKDNLGWDYENFDVNKSKMLHIPRTDSSAWPTVGLHNVFAE